MHPHRRQRQFPSRLHFQTPHSHVIPGIAPSTDTKEGAETRIISIGPSKLFTHILRPMFQADITQTLLTLVTNALMILSTILWMIMTMIGNQLLKSSLLQQTTKVGHSWVPMANQLKILLRLHLPLPLSHLLLPLSLQLLGCPRLIHVQPQNHLHLCVSTWINLLPITMALSACL